MSESSWVRAVNMYRSLHQLPAAPALNKWEPSCRRKCWINIITEETLTWTTVSPSACWLHVLFYLLHFVLQQQQNKHRKLKTRRVGQHPPTAGGSTATTKGFGWTGLSLKKLKHDWVGAFYIWTWCINELILKTGSCSVRWGFRWCFKICSC